MVKLSGVARRRARVEHITRDNNRIYLMHFYLAARRAALRQIELPSKTRLSLIRLWPYIPLAKHSLGQNTVVPADRNPYQRLEYDAYGPHGINRTDRKASKVTLRRGTS